MEPGSPALLRDVWRGRVAWAVPVTVVADDPDEVRLLRRAGTPTKQAAHGSIDELFAHLAAGTFEVEDATWRHTAALEIAPLGRWASIWVMWFEPSWEFAAWYVNFQRPLQRTPLGWDTRDLSLDLVVSADRSWRWKDEDHFALLDEHGLLGPGEADEIRREGDRIVADIEAARPPFDRDWSAWRPDPAWGRPTMPDGWADVDPGPA